MLHDRRDGISAGERFKETGDPCESDNMSCVAEMLFLQEELQRTVGLLGTCFNNRFLHKTQTPLLSK